MTPPTSIRWSVASCKPSLKRFSNSPLKRWVFSRRVPWKVAN